MSSENQPKNSSQYDLEYENFYRQFEQKIPDSEATDCEKDEHLDALHIAVQNQNISLVREILRKKPNLQSTKGGHILWDAIFEDNHKIASILIRYGANVNVSKPNDDFKSSLLFELGSSRDLKHHKLALLIIEYGAEASEYEIEYIFCRAIDSGSLKLFEALLKRTSIIRHSIIHQAVRSPYVVELIKLLIQDNNADVKIKYMRAVAMFYQLYVVPGGESRILPAVEALLDQKLDINEINADGGVLVHSIRCRKIKVIQLLIKHGINVNKRTKDGILPLFSAASTDQPKIVRMLLKAGARIDDRSGSDKCPRALYHGQCALHAACKGREKTIVLKILLSYGADMNVVDIFRRTPFSHMQSTGQLNEAQKIVIKHFAILETKRMKIHYYDKEIIDNDLLMRKFRDECISELKLMRSINLSRDATFYSILVKNVQMVSFFLRSCQFRERYDEYRVLEQFPCYVEDIEAKVNVAEKQKKSMTDKEKMLCNSLEDVLPYPALENIVLFLYLDAVDSQME